MIFSVTIYFIGQLNSFTCRISADHGPLRSEYCGLELPQIEVLNRCTATDVGGLLLVRLLGLDLPEAQK